MDAHHVRRVGHHVCDRRRNSGVVHRADGLTFRGGGTPALHALHLRQFGLDRRRDKGLVQGPFHHVLDAPKAAVHRRAGDPRAHKGVAELQHIAVRQFGDRRVAVHITEQADGEDGVCRHACRLAVRPPVVFAAMIRPEGAQFGDGHAHRIVAAYLARMFLPIARRRLFRHLAGAIRPHGMFCAGGLERDLPPPLFSWQLYGIVPEAVIVEYRPRLLQFHLCTLSALAGLNPARLL